MIPAYRIEVNGGILGNKGRGGSGRPAARKLRAPPAGPMFGRRERNAAERASVTSTAVCRTEARRTLVSRMLADECERRAEKPALGRGLRRIMRGGVLGRTRQFVTDTWFGRTNTTVTNGEEHRCSRTWKNGLRFVAGC